MGDIFRDTFLGFVRVHVLYHASKGRIFGAEMIQELRKHGYAMSPGTLYPILHALEKAKYLRSEQEVIGGKVRKYYQISALGRRIFSRLQEKVRELTSEVLEETARELPLAKGRRSVRK